jgi:hypothetical protein
MSTHLQVFCAPYSCMVLFQGDQVWMPAASGIPESSGDPPGWCMATCPWTLLQPHPETLVVPDVALDGRFAHTIWVELGIRWAVVVLASRHQVGCTLSAAVVSCTS